MIKKVQLVYHVVHLQKQDSDHEAVLRGHCINEILHIS